MPTWDHVTAIADALPETQESTSYRTPALKVRGKTFARLRTESDERLVVMCGLDEKEALLAEGGPFSTTSHYDGYGAILVDLERIDLERLAEILEDGWRSKAPKRVVAAFDASERDS